jgi:hypothetical protein
LSPAITVSMAATIEGWMPSVGSSSRSARGRVATHGLERTDAVDEAVALFPALRGLWHRPGGNLSGGRHPQVLGHGEIGKDLAPLRHVGEA